MKINYSNVIYPFSLTSTDYPSYNDWAGLIFFCGCDFLCNNCHNFELRNYNLQKNTKVFYVDSFIKELDIFCKKNSLTKLVFSGGDCLAKINRDFTKEVLEELNNKYEICIYTGYTVEEITEFKITKFSYIKCGSYDENKKQIGFTKLTDKNFVFTLASSNQNFYDSNYKLLSKKGVLTTKRR